LTYRSIADLIDSVAYPRDAAARVATEGLRL
jgi:hypothetical protein